MRRGILILWVVVLTGEIRHHPQQNSRSPRDFSAAVELQLKSIWETDRQARCHIADDCWGGPSFDARWYSRSAVVVVAKVLQDVGVDICGDPLTSLEVVEVLHDTAAVCSPASQIVLQLDRELRNEPVLLLSGLLADGNNPAVDWERRLPVTPRYVEFVRGIPDFETPRESHVEYAVRHFEDPDPLVAMTVYSEFWLECPSPETDRNRFNEVVRTIPREKLRNCLQRPEAGVRRSLYGELLGFCGDEDDIPLLEKLVVDSGNQGLRQGIQGIVVGYLLLAGEEGLGVVEETFLANPDAVESQIKAVVEALRKLWRYGQHKISSERLMQSMRLGLSRREIAPDAIRCLAAWKDWSVMEEVVSMYQNGENSSRPLNAQTILYLYAAVNDVPMDARKSDPLPSHAMAAKKHLEALRANDPKVFKVVEQLFY